MELPKDFSKLISVGIVTQNSFLIVYKQGKKSEVLHQVKIENVQGIALTKTDKRNYHQNGIFWHIIGGLRKEPIHAPIIYKLTVYMKEEPPKIAYISSFDLAGVNAAIKNFNSNLENGFQ